MLGVYAPLTPGDGLRFDATTEVTPQVYSGYGYYGRGGRSRRMDVTQGQHLAGGWVVARAPAHFGLRKVEPRRERLDISRNDDGTLQVVNGLGVPIRTLYVADGQGNRYRAENLAAGASQTMSGFAPGAMQSGPLNAIRNEGWSAATRIAASPGGWVQPRQYVAILDHATLLEPGLDDLKAHDIESVVIGRWEEGG
jgi:hypothetical protein